MLLDYNICQYSYEGNSKGGVRFWEKAWLVLSECQDEFESHLQLNKCGCREGFQNINK